jgi:hypothetical protein
MIRPRKHAEDLKPHELREIVHRVQEALWHKEASAQDAEEGADEEWVAWWDRDIEDDFEAVQEITRILRNFDLAPEEVEDDADG